MLATNEGDNNAWKKFGSTEAGLPAMLNVSYTPPNRPPYVASGVTPSNGSVFGTPTTSVSAVYSDPDGGSGQLAFGVWNYQNQLVWSRWTSSLCSGCGITLNVPAMPDNWYYVMVIGWDGAQYSGGNAAPTWSAQQWFFIDTLPPAATGLTPVNGASGNAPTQVSTRYSEPYGFTGYVYFWLYTTGGTRIVENWSTVTNSGSAATLAIPALAAGTYNLWAMPWDTRQTGPQIGPNTFTVGAPTTTTTAVPPTTTAPPNTTTTIAPTTTTTVAPTTSTTVHPTTTTTVPPRSGTGRTTPIADGGRHSLVVNNDGSVFSWGANDSGQLGDGFTTNNSVGAVVPNFTNVVSVAAGEAHSLAVKSDGTAWAWGANGSGQLGVGTFESSSAPVQVARLTGVSAIAGGLGHSLALEADGTVWAWGAGGFGQLGNGQSADSSIPVRVPALSGVIAIAAGNNHSLAITSDGSVWAWGENAFGELGDGTTNNSNVPRKVTGISGATAVAAGTDHVLALTADGAVWGWGNNTFGQLGNNTTDSAPGPIQVTSLSGATAIAAGSFHSVAMKTDGSVWAWGLNDRYQLGVNDTTNRLGPVQVLHAPTGALLGATAIAAGTNHSLAVTSDGKISEWGHHNYQESDCVVATDKPSDPRTPAQPTTGTVDLPVPPPAVNCEGTQTGTPRIIPVKLYAFNAAGPRGARPSDVQLAPDGSVCPAHDPDDGRLQQGASAFEDVAQAPLTGAYWSVAAGTPLPDGLAEMADGPEVFPGSSMPVGHHTFYPTRVMSFDQFNSLFKGLPWVRGGTK